MDQKALILTIAVFIFGGATLFVACRNMTKGFGSYNLKVLGIILIATFASLIGINHENSVTATMGILGAIAGYLFGIKDHIKDQQ